MVTAVQVVSRYIYTYSNITLTIKCSRITIALKSLLSNSLPSYIIVIVYY